MTSNRITAETTNDQILEQIKVAQANLMEKALEASSSEFQMGKDLVHAAQAVRNAEALASAQIQYKSVLANKPENAVALLASLLGRGADDTWSGRDNDSARAAFDVVRQWTSNELDNIRYSA